MIGLDARNWGALLGKFGLPGPAAPIPRDSLLVGGANNGRRIGFTVDCDLLNVPVPRSTRFTLAPLERLAALDAIETYETRLVVPCFDAAPIKIWAIPGLPEVTTRALYEEHRG